MNLRVARKIALHPMRWRAYGRAKVRLALRRCSRWSPTSDELVIRNHRISGMVAAQVLASVPRRARGPHKTGEDGSSPSAGTGGAP